MLINNENLDAKLLMEIVQLVSTVDKVFFEHLGTFKKKGEQKWLSVAVVTHCAFCSKFTEFDREQENFFRSKFQG